MMLDCAEPPRTGEAAICGELAEETLCVDHHVNNGEYASYNLICPQATSTCEILFDLFEELEYPLTQPEAEALFTGLAFDTGGFRHSSMTGRAFYMAGRLAEAGADITRAMNGLFHTKSLLEAKVLSVILRKAKLYKNRIIISVMEGKDFLSVGASSDDSEGAVAQLAEVAEAEAAVFMRELQPGLIRVNMRSKSCVDVARVARVFGGGGHIRAAGCTVSEPMLVARQLILNELMKQMPEEE